MNLTNKDYLDIISFYKIDVSNMNKRQIKERAENILANKLCRCIKKVDPFVKNEQNAIALCRKTVLLNKNIINYGFRCKGKAKFVPKKGTSKNLAKYKKSKTRKKR
jgi:predicted glycosyltransferase